MLSDDVAESIKQIGGWNLSKGIEIIHTAYTLNIDYEEMKQIFLMLKDRLVWLKPQEAKDPVDKDTQYKDLFNNLSTTMQSKLNEIIKNTAKWNYREDWQEYTRNELLEKQWFKQFIWLIN